MGYKADPAPTGQGLPSVVAYLQREFQKLEADSLRVDVTFEAFIINGVGSTWSWTDDQTSTDPGAGKIGGDAVTASSITELRLSYTDLFGRDLPRVLRSLSISNGDLVELTSKAGTLGGFYQVIADPVNFDTWMALAVVWVDGDSGNIPTDELMGFRWAFTPKAAVS